MKYSIRSLTIITLIAASALTGCENKSRDMDRANAALVEAEKDLNDAQNDVQAELQRFRADMSERTEEFDNKIRVIKRKIRNESDDEIKDDLEEKLDELENSYDEMKQDIRDFNSSERSDWDRFKEDFTDKMDNIGDSIDDFFSEDLTKSTN